MTAATPERSYDALLRAAAALGRRTFGAAACSLALLDDDEEHLVFRAASGEGAAGVIGLQLPVTSGIAGWVASSGHPIAVDEVRRDARFARDFAESTGYVPQTILAAPLETSERVLGVIEVLDRAQVPDRDDLGLLCLLAHQVSLGVEIGRSFDRWAADSGSGRNDELGGMVAELAALGAADQQSAAALVRVFLEHVRRSSGRAGLV